MRSFLVSWVTWDGRLLDGRKIVAETALDAIEKSAHGVPKKIRPFCVAVKCSTYFEPDAPPKEVKNPKSFFKTAKKK